jgi:hypothetical protein
MSTGVNYKQHKGMESIKFILYMHFFAHSISKSVDANTLIITLVKSLFWKLKVTIGIENTQNRPI